MLICSCRKRLVQMTKILPSIRKEFSHQKFAVKKLKTLASQNQSQIQSEFKAVQQFVQESIINFSQSLTCDGSCVHIKEKLAGNHLYRLYF